MMTFQSFKPILFTCALAMASPAMAQIPPPLFPVAVFSEQSTEEQILAFANELEADTKISREELERNRLEITQQLLEKGSSGAAIWLMFEYMKDPPQIERAFDACKQPRMMIAYPYNLTASKAFRVMDDRYKTNYLLEDADRTTAFIFKTKDYHRAGMDGTNDLDVLFLMLDELSDNETIYVYNSYLKDNKNLATIEGTRLALSIGLRLNLELNAGKLNSVPLWEYWQRKNQMSKTEQDYFLNVIRERDDFQSALERSNEKSSISSPEEKGASNSFVLTEQNLGYPVPIRVDSETPVDGFRTYEALLDRYTNLANSNSTITRFQSGTSFRNRPIYSFEFLKDSINTPEGIEKAAVVFEGGLHAREWAAQEAVAAIFEWLALEESTDPMAAYILDQVNLVIHPLANPDGILQTQRFANEVTSGSFRDGRLRRKNMRDVDESLGTSNDHQLGVDLNRNFENGWSRQSSSQSSIAYRGPAILSEPESQTLDVATSNINTNRLRLFKDYHSFGPFYYTSISNSSSYNNAAFGLESLMSSAISATTGLVNASTSTTNIFSQGIGATEETYALRYGCLAYTPEVRPPQTTNVSSTFRFILPNAEVADLKAEQLAATRTALYYISGAASIQVLEIRDSNGTVVFRREWNFNSGSGTRQVSDTIAGSVVAGNSYSIALFFNKPLRTLTDSSEDVLPGVSASPVMLSISQSAGSLSGTYSRDSDGIPPLRYEGDTIVFDWTVDVSSAGELISLSCTGEDAAGQAIDANPATVVDWSDNGWINLESGPLNLGSIPVTELNGSDVFIIK